jgi:hypothetical protein
MVRTSCGKDLRLGRGDGVTYLWKVIDRRDRANGELVIAGTIWRALGSTGIEGMI